MGNTGDSRTGCGTETDAGRRRVLLRVSFLAPLLSRLLCPHFPLLLVLFFSLSLFKFEFGGLMPLISSLFFLGARGLRSVAWGLRRKKSLIRGLDEILKQLLAGQSLCTFDLLLIGSQLRRGRLPGGRSKAEMKRLKPQSLYKN